MFSNNDDVLAKLQAQVDGMAAELATVKAIAVDAAGERAHYYANIDAETLARIDRVQEALRAHFRCGEGEQRYRSGVHREHAVSPIAIACRAIICGDG